MLTPRRLERLSFISDDGAECLNVASFNNDLRADEVLTHVNRGEYLAVTEPEPPVEVLDTLVPALRYLMDGREAHRGLVLELKI